MTCEGTLDGAHDRNVLPPKWNGALLYSHGYHSPRPCRPTESPAATDAVPAPGDDVAKVLVAEGDALAGSSYSRNDWAVPEGVAAGR